MEVADEVLEDRGLEVQVLTELESEGEEVDLVETIMKK